MREIERGARFFHCFSLDSFLFIIGDKARARGKDLKRCLYCGRQGAGAGQRKSPTKKRFFYYFFFLSFFFLLGSSEADLACFGEMIRWGTWGMGGALLLFALAVLPHGEAVYTKVSGPFLAP